MDSRLSVAHIEVEMTLTLLLRVWSTQQQLQQQHYLGLVSNADSQPHPT